MLAAPTTSLNVDPGGAATCVTCSSIGLAGRCASRVERPVVHGWAEDAVVVGRPARHGEDLAVPRVQDDRAAEVTAGLARYAAQHQVELPGELALQAQVEGEPQGAPAPGRGVAPECHRRAGRRDVDALAAVDAAQDRVVDLLQPGAADEGPQGQVGPAFHLDGSGHAGPAQHGSEHATVEIAPAGVGDDEDPGQPGLADPPARRRREGGDGEVAARPVPAELQAQAALRPRGEGGKGGHVGRAAPAPAPPPPGRAGRRRRGGSRAGR